MLTLFGPQRLALDQLRELQFPYLLQHQGMLMGGTLLEPVLTLERGLYQELVPQL
jgi:hypothetical protein